MKMPPTWKIQCLLLVLGTYTAITNADRAPYFVPGTGDMARLEISEATPVGTPVYQLRAIDPDGGPIQYSISGTRLSVDPQTGVITLREELDRERQPLIEVVISATDLADNTASLRRIVQVSDVNDNSPQFLGRPYSAEVKEDVPIGFRLPLNIRVTDADLGRNAEVTVDCERDGGRKCELFKVNTERLNSEGEYRISIEILRPLDHETRAAHVLTLRARDSGDLRMSAAATVAITVLDVQDRPPEFLDAPYSAAVTEGAPPGTSVLEIAARDGDAGESRREVHLKLHGDHLGFFTLQPKSSSSGTSRAILATSDTPLDREHQLVQQAGGVYTFDVIAAEVDPETGMETEDIARSQITVIITDADDQLPEFDSPVYSASVRENALIGDQVPGLSITVTDGDVGVNARYHLRLQDAENSQPGAVAALRISPENGEGRTPLLVRIADPSLLDYEAGVRQISVEVIASREENSEPLASARINLKILDSNDHAPIFAHNTYRYRIRENASIGARIDNDTTPLIAEDADDGEFGHVMYAVRGFGAGVFTTDAQNGGLRVASTLDRERQAAYTLSVEARDGGGRVTQVNVHVDIEDVNDNAPQFEQREYSRVVREGATTFDPQLFVRATDADGAQQGGGRVRYSLDEPTSTEWGEVFFVDPETGEVRMLRAVTASDAPRGQYELQVKATDAGVPPLQNTTRVIVRVGLVGNQRPAWRGAERDRLYHAEIPETAPAGHLVTTVRAHDPDGPDSLVRYRLAGGGEDNFLLDELTGELRVSTDARLDRDAENAPSKYDVLVAAVDGGPGPLRETATATIQVKITDVNDESPRFPQQNLTGYISERASIGTAVLRVVAIDPDEGSIVRYTLGDIRALDGAGLPVRTGSVYNPRQALSIDDKTGEIHVAGLLDHRAAAVLLVQIIAKDIAAVNKNQNSSVDATIYVQAYEDDTPMFQNDGWTHSRPELHVQLEEERPIGTRVVELRAYDPRNNRPVTRFQVVHADTDALTVVPDGEILLTRRVDYERPGDKLLKLTVEGLAEDGRTAEAHIFVHVVDLNDNAPRFEKDEYEVSIPESARNPQIVIQVRAIDKDIAETEEEIVRGYGVVTYSLAGGGSGGPWEVNPQTGEIRVLSGAILDRERQAQYVLEVTARDGGGRKATCVVHVTITDVNDNAPRWTSSGELTAVIPENAAPGERAIDLHAIDPDLGEGGKVFYELTDEGEAAGLFTLNSQSGRLEVARPLTGKGRIEPYVLTVRARDGGGLSTDAPLHLYVGDVSANDGVPEWIKPASNEQAKVSENATVGSVVYRAKAVDPDDPLTPSGRVTYSLLDGDGEAATFTIDTSTGLVTLRRPLDRERRDHYTLVLVASDGGTPPQQASVVLQVIVTDVDDNPPRFSRLPDDPPQLLEVDEEVPIGTHIGNVQAFDPDLEENAAISYHLTDGNEFGLFSIKDSGAIVSAGRLDREEQSQHLLTVRCTKRNMNPPKKQPFNRLNPAELQVLIRLRDVDDNEPQFLGGENVTVGVRAWTQADALVTRLEAHDADSTAGALEYHLAGGDFTPGQLNLLEDSLTSTNVTEIFRLDTTTGEVRTTRPLASFADGAFTLHAEAISGDRVVVSRVRVHVARDRDLLRWVFARAPTDVRRDISNFERAIMETVGNEVRPLVYDARFLARRDGSLDFGATGVCFALVPTDEGTGAALPREETLRVLNENEVELRRVYENARVTAVERCDGAAGEDGTGTALPRATTAQAWLLAVALFVGIAGLISCIVLCCMHCTYRRRTSRRMRLLHEPPPMHPPIYPEPLYST